MKIRQFFTISSVLAVALASSSCTDLFQLNPDGGRGLRFKVILENGGMDTKASSEETLETVGFDVDGIPFFVTPSIEVNNGYGANALPETKGAIVNKDSLVTATKGTGIPMYMITKNASKTKVDFGYLKEDDIQDKKDGEEYWALFDNNGNKIDWVEADEILGGKATFLSYYNEAGTDVVTNVDYENLKFTYKGITSNFTLGVSADNAATDASRMKDFIIAHTAGIDHQTDHGTDDQVNEVELHYYHPLAAIRFKTPVAKDRDESVVISRVTINNVKTGGYVTYNTNTDIASPTAFKTAFTWDTSGCTTFADYAQEFSTDLDEMTFFIVPQDLTNVVVTFNIIHNLSNGEKHEHQLSAPVSKLGVTSWDQGYIYNYTLDTKALGKVNISIDETVNDPLTVKTNVSIENKSQSTAFVRAKVFADWCTDSGKIIYSYPLTLGTDNGEVDINTDNWKLGKDGFYYCNRPVRGYSNSPVFIKKFEMPTTLDSVPYEFKTQVEGLHMEMRIMAQAIESDTWDPGQAGTAYIKLYWGDSNGKILLADGTTDLLTSLKF